MPSYTYAGLVEARSLLGLDQKVQGGEMLEEGWAGSLGARSVDQRSQHFLKGKRHGSFAF